MGIKGIIKDTLRWIYLFPVRYGVQRIPLAWSYVIGGWGGYAAYGLLRKKRDTYERELNDPSFAIHGTRKAEVVRRTFRNLVQSEMEVLYYPKLNSSNIRTIVSSQGLEHLDEAISAGRGIMLLFAHFGANQMIMPAVGYRGYRMCQMSAPPTVWIEKLPTKRFSRMDKKALEIRWECELSLPVRHINIFGSLKEAFLCLKRNEILGIAIDGGGGSDRVCVPFLGRNALFSVGALSIAMRTGCTVLPTFMVRDRTGRNTMIIEQPLTLFRDTDRNDAIKKNVELFVGRLEEYVRRHPCHYLNFLALRRFMTEQGDTPFFVETDTDRNMQSHEDTACIPPASA